MKRDAFQQPPFDSCVGDAIFQIASESSSSSSRSVCSDSGSQHSDDYNSIAGSSDTESCDSYCFSQPSHCSSQSSVSSVESACEPVSKYLESQPKQCYQQTQPELPQELRQNPRRTRPVDGFRAPKLARQGERKVNFVDNLVGKDWPSTRCLGHMCLNSMPRFIDIYCRGYLAHIVGSCSQ